VLACDPRAWPIPQPRTRWTLEGLRAAVPSLWGYSLSGVWRILTRHKLRWKRARDHLRSPDPDYLEKVAHLRAIQARVADQPATTVLLYLDEVTYYRQPSLASGYAPVGRAEPRAERSTRSNTATRVIGALDAATGRVVAHQKTRIGVPALIGFYRALVEAYPGRQIYVVQDNWPVHFHPDVLAALEPQTSPFPFLRPRSWPAEPGPRAKKLNLPIQLVALPTYSLAQPHREALALAQAGRPPPPSQGQRPPSPPSPHPRLLRQVRT
jgi:DDE superfamily endonuclease/Winged helix-turn helix